MKPEGFTPSEGSSSGQQLITFGSDSPLVQPPPILQHAGMRLASLRSGSRPRPHRSLWETSWETTVSQHRGDMCAAFNGPLEIPTCATAGTLQKTFAQHVTAHPQVPNYHVALQLHLPSAPVLHHTLVRRHFRRVKYPRLSEHGTAFNGNRAEAATRRNEGRIWPSEPSSGSTFWYEALNLRH